MASTTVNSSQLDFNNIKESLKSHLQKQDEFADYDFEASGLSNILDVLAYNTHLNALTANFSLNESFLGTAQLRSSIVSIATSVGYVPATRTSAFGTVNISMSITGDRPSVIELPAYTRFTANVDDVSYIFQTKESYIAADDGNGNYLFETSSGSTNIPIYEGTLKTKSFLVGEFNESDVYIIPDTGLDADTVTVNVYESVTGTSFIPYTNIIDTNTINENSTIYILKEAPNEFYQLSFGGNGILGANPEANNLIEVKYISTNGPDANSATNFVAIDGVLIDGVSQPLNVQTVSRAVGGDVKESKESIRRNAPFQYATQNRMVTSDDYTSIIRRNFGTLISDIKSWGGEENPEPKFGTIFSSILFEDDVTESVIATTKSSIEDLVDQLAVVTFNVEFADPIKTYVESNIFFQMNPKLTPLSINALKNQVEDIVNIYFNEAIGGFDKSFRRSNLLTAIDEVSPAILSSRCEIRMQKRITPTINAVNTYKLSFPVDIAETDNNEYRVMSTPFLMDTVVCRIQNELNTNNLQIVNTGNGEVVVDSIGNFNPTVRTVDIIAFKPTGTFGNDGIIKISVTPANQSAISPVRNDILEYDQELSRIKPVLVGADN